MRVPEPRYPGAREESALVCVEHASAIRVQSDPFHYFHGKFQGWSEGHRGDGTIARVLERVREARPAHRIVAGREPRFGTASGVFGTFAKGGPEQPKKSPAPAAYCFYNLPLVTSHLPQI